MIYECPRCNNPVVTDYINTGGQHWHCPTCGRNSSSYTVICNPQTGRLDEIPYIIKPRWIKTIDESGRIVNLKCQKCGYIRDSHVLLVLDGEPRYCEYCGSAMEVDEYDNTKH